MNGMQKREETSPSRHDPHARVRWAIYAVTAAAAFFIVGFVALWQIALAAVLPFESSLGAVMVAMFAVGLLFVAVAIGALFSARPAH